MPTPPRPPLTVQPIRPEEAEVLFDEADSLFGKRTTVSDSNDRYANEAPAEPPKPPSKP